MPENKRNSHISVERSGDQPAAGKSDGHRGPTMRDASVLLILRVRESATRAELARGGRRKSLGSRNHQVSPAVGGFRGRPPQLSPTARVGYNDGKRDLDLARARRANASFAIL